MKPGRLMAVLFELQHSGKRSATALAEQLEVSVRTIYRDVDALSAAGVPVYAERGSQGGIVLADRYREALGRFGDAELRALFVSADDALTDLGLGSDRRSALDKLARAVPAHSRAALERSRGRVHVDARRWLGVTSPSAPLATLRQAVWGDRCVSIAYSDRAGKVTRRVVEPLGLVTKAGIWYFVAGDGETVKTFRVQRIARVRILERRFVRPGGFDVGAYWQDVAARIARDEEPYRATFRMTRRALANAEIYFTVESRTRERGSDPPAWLVQIAFAAFMPALQEAMSWGDDAVAVDPPELREALAARGHALLARYGTDDPSR